MSRTFAIRKWAQVSGAVLAVAVGMTALAQDRDVPSAPREEIPAKVWLKTAPAGGRTIAQTQTSAKVGDAVVLKGVVADRDDALSPVEARMVLVDSGEGSDQPAASAIVIVADGSGQARRVSLLGHEGLGRGAEVLVVGKVSAAASDGPLTVAATGVHVVKPVLPAGFFLTAAPEQGKFVADAKKEARAGDAVQVRGKIGGSRNPFVNGRAVFTIVGNGIKDCSEKDDDHCKTPWDYCCDTRKDIAAQSATIQIVDVGGKPLKLDVKGLQGLKELSDVTIVGKAVVADGQALVVQATGMYINRP